MTSPADLPPATPAGPPIPAADLVRLSQGFYFIFWGLLVAVLVGAQTMVVFWLHTFAEIFLAAGVLAVLVGTWRLSQARLESAPRAGGAPEPQGQPDRPRDDPALPALTVVAWRRRTRVLFVLAVLLTYFCLFFYMWRRVPLNVYLQVNAVTFVAVGILYVTMLGRAVRALAALLGRTELALESRLFGIGNVLLLILPFVSALLVLIVRTIVHRSNPLLEFRFLLARINLGVSILLLLPFALTLSLVWTAKDAAVRQLSLLPVDS